MAVIKLSDAQLDAVIDALGEALGGGTLDTWADDELAPVRAAREQMRVAWNAKVPLTAGPKEEID